MEEYILKNLVIHDEQYIIFNVESSRIFTLGKQINSLERELRKVNQICDKKITHKKDLNEIIYRNLVISCAEVCNLDCSYCFAGAGQYRGQGSKRLMEDADFDKLLSFIVEHKDEVQTINFFGGEPLLTLSEIQRFLDKLSDFYSFNNLKMPRLGMVTNGTLFHEEAVALVNKYKISVSISLDGNKETNDECRCFPDKHQSVFDLVIKNIKDIKKKEFLLTIVSTYSRKNILKYKRGDYAAILDFYKGIGVDAVECVIADQHEEVTSEERNQIQLFAQDQVSHIFQMIKKNHNLEILSRIPLGAISTIVKKQYHPECPVGKRIFYYTVDGKLYPCQLYYAAGVKETKFLSRTEHPICKNCFCQNICAFYCSGSCVMANGTEIEIVETRCIFSKALYKECIQQLHYYMRDTLDEEEKNVFIRNMIQYSKLYRDFTHK